MPRPESHGYAGKSIAERHHSIAGAKAWRLNRFGHGQSDRKAVEGAYISYIAIDNAGSSSNRRTVDGRFSLATPTGVTC